MSASKVNLKNLLEEQVEQLEKYHNNDIQEYPGWTFLLSQIIKRYGICPFLNVDDEECKIRRLTWLYEQDDQGRFYHDTVNYLTNEHSVQQMENTILDIRNEIDLHVKKCFAVLNLPDDFTYDILMDNIRQRKSKSQNQQSKGEWKQTIRAIEYIATMKGFDFTKYVHVVHGISMQRFKSPEITEVVDKKFQNLYDIFIDTSEKLEALQNLREKEKSDAEKYLANLIKNDFKIDQSGRYFKKWTSLTSEKKEDRIKSYCEWFMRQHKKPINRADAMKKWIIDKLESKELRVMDIKWDMQLGIITHVSLEMNENGSFQLCKRAPRVLKVRKISRKKKEELFQSSAEKELLTRANRLMLYEILKSQSTSKEFIVKLVESDLQTRLVPQQQLTEYLSQKFDEMISLIKANPYV